MRAYTKTSCVAVRLAVLYSLLPIAALLSGCSGQAANEKELKEKQIRELRGEVAGVFGTKWILEKEDWCERHSVSDQEYDTLVKNWQNRTSYDGFSPSEAFWEVAKNSTPERLSKEFPALTDKEWFTAEIPTSIFNWRKFERPFSFGEEEPYKLSIWVRIRTVPNKPISRLQGLLSIKGPGGEELHSEMIDDQSDVSFQDSTVYQCEWNYDDNNPKHRTLRFSDGLSAHFDVRHVTFKDDEAAEQEAAETHELGESIPEDARGSETGAADELQEETPTVADTQPLEQKLKTLTSPKPRERPKQADETWADPWPEEKPKLTEQPAIRMWRDATGEYSVEAEFVGMAFGKVKLRRKSGQVIEIPMDRLSEECQEWIRDRSR